jgi:hypothetical protein
MLTVFLVLSMAMLPLQDDKSRGRKGDSVTLRGCLNGASLDATDADEPEVQAALVGGLTFQLKGDKQLLKDLKAQHDGKVVTLKGVLKSDLLQSEGQSKTVGRMRITIGGATPNPNSPHADTRRALPVLEVKSFNGTGTTACR